MAEAVPPHPREAAPWRGNELAPRRGDELAPRRGDERAPERACGPLGRLLAQGLLSRAECAEALGRAASRLPGDPRGRRTRLVWDLLTAARWWRLARDEAAERIEAALDHLLAPGLDRRAPRRVLLDAARRADRRAAFTADEREAIALAAVRRRLRGGETRWGRWRP